MAYRGGVIEHAPRGQEHASEGFGLSIRVELIFPLEVLFVHFALPACVHPTDSDTQNSNDLLVIEGVLIRGGWKVRVPRHFHVQDTLLLPWFQIQRPLLAYANERIRNVVISVSVGFCESAQLCELLRVSKRPSTDHPFSWLRSVRVNLSQSLGTCR